MPGPNTPYTQLSANQTITQSFDENQDGHRVIPILNGNAIDSSNPLPVQLSTNPTINIGDVAILVNDTEVNYSNPLPVTGSLPFPYDYGSLALSNGDTTETYTFKVGGSGGTNTGTVVINYTDSSRNVLVNFQIMAA